MAAAHNNGRVKNDLTDEAREVADLETVLRGSDNPYDGTHHTLLETSTIPIEQYATPETEPEPSEPEDEYLDDSALTFPESHPYWQIEDENDPRYSEAEAVNAWEDSSITRTYPIDHHLFEGLLQQAEALRERDPRLAKVCAQALIAAGAPVRRSGDRLYVFTGTHYEDSESANPDLIRWLNEMLSRVMAQKARPRWQTFSHRRDERGSVHIGQGSWQWAENPVLRIMTRGWKGMTPDSAAADLHYDVKEDRWDEGINGDWHRLVSRSWPEPAARLLALWHASPEEAIKAIRAATPEGGIMLQDPVNTLNTGTGMLYLPEDGTIRRFDDDDLARKLGITHRTAPLPDDLAEAWERPWQDFAPHFAMTLAIAQPNPEVQDWLQRLAYAMLTGRAQEDCLPWFYGDSGSGKTTIANGMASAAGTLSAEVEPAKFIAVSKVARDVSSLKGIRIVTFSEMNGKYAADTAWLKRLTGGDMMPGTPAWRGQFMLLPTSNNLPTFNDTRGMPRRLRVVPFNHVIPDPDIRVRHRVEQEGMGILLWALHGGESYARHLAKYGSGLAPVPAPIVKASLAALVSGNPLESFCAMLSDSPTPMPFATLYNEFREMCRTAEAAVPSKKALGSELERRGYEWRKGHAGMKLYFVKMQPALHGDD